MLYMTRTPREDIGKWSDSRLSARMPYMDSLCRVTVRRRKQLTESAYTTCNGGRKRKAFPLRFLVFINEHHLIASQKLRHNIVTLFYSDDHLQSERVS